MDGQPAGVFVSGMQIFRAIKLDEDAPDQPDATKFGYKLIGPQGQEYHLMRVFDRPHLLIALDMKRRIQAPTFKGTLFTDTESELKIATAR
jgi:hypothetical protein